MSTDQIPAEVIDAGWSAYQTAVSTAKGYASPAEAGVEAAMVSAYAAGRKQAAVALVSSVILSTTGCVHRAEWSREAAAVVAALAAAGRLQPAGGETRTEYGVRLRWDGGAIEEFPRETQEVADRTVALHAQARAEFDNHAVTAERVERIQWTGPWRPAPTGDPVCTCPDKDVHTWADLGRPIEEWPTLKGLDPNCPIHGKTTDKEH